MPPIIAANGRPRKPTGAGRRGRAFSQHAAGHANERFTPADSIAAIAEMQLGRAVAEAGLRGGKADPRLLRDDINLSRAGNGAFARAVGIAA